MSIPIGLSHDEYVTDRLEKDSSFGSAYDEVKATMELALALTDLREYRSLSQRALAEKTGMKQPMINRIERGMQVPRPLTLLRMLAALNGVLTMGPDGSICVSPTEATTSPRPIPSRPGQPRHRGVHAMPASEGASKAASRVLRDPKSGTSGKRAAASDLAQRPHREGKKG
jgi:transcriptional regulator with XRE-family HTH domain